MREVKIVWLDSGSFTNQWMEFEKATKLPMEPVETKGFLVAETPDRLIIAQTRSQDALEVYNVMVIPKVCVVEVQDA